MDPTTRGAVLDVTTRVTAEQVVRLHAKLAALRSIEPSELADPLFAELMRMSISSSGENTDDLFADPRVRAVLSDLRRLSAAGEYQRELLWSRRVIASSDPRSTFGDVPFHANYRRLLAFEVGGVRASVNPEPRRALMIGSGPMPITLVLLSQMLGSELVGLDVNAEACTLARSFCASVGAAVSVHECDAMDFEHYGDFDFVVLAASVGLDRGTRLKILARLAETMSPGAALVVRTAHGMRRLMFPQLDPCDLDGFECQYLVQPLDRVVNSMLIARKS